MKHLLSVFFLLPATAQADHMFDGRDLERGAALYAENCAACHGANLEGQPNWREAGPDGVLPAPPHDVNGHTWHHDTGLLFTYVKFGGAKTLEARGIADFNSGMPGFEDLLSDEDILDTLAFIRESWPQMAKDVQAKRTHPDG